LEITDRSKDVLSHIDGVEARGEESGAHEVLRTFIIDGGGSLSFLLDRANKHGRRMGKTSLDKY